MLRRWPGSGGDGYGDRQLTTPRRSDPWPSRRRYGSEKMTPYISDKDGDSRMADQSQYQLFETAAGIAAIGWKGGDITRSRLPVPAAPATARAIFSHFPGSSEERRVGQYCVSKCRFRWSSYHYKKQNKN